MPAVSLTATLLATVLGFGLGALWYGPLFGARWMAELGMSADELRKDFNPAKTYGATFVLGLVAAYVFGLFVGPAPGRAFAVVTGAGAGLCWVATALATNYLFERRSLVLIGINGGYHAVRFALIGLAFGLVG
jgi:hypothetical protein